MGRYASLQNKRRELEARGQWREGGGKEGQRKPPQNLKDLVTAMNLPAKAEQPENRPEEVLEETCAVQN